jgi:hypothetical protein
MRRPRAVTPAQRVPRKNQGIDLPHEDDPMPGKQHLPNVSSKEQRMYEHIKESELEQGRSTKRAKSIAAATVVKHHNEEDHAAGK